MVPKTLNMLSAAVGGEILGDPEVAVTDVTHDSRQAGPGTMFIAIRTARPAATDFFKFFIHIACTLRTSLVSSESRGPADPLAGAQPTELHQRGLSILNSLTIR